MERVNVVMSKKQCQENFDFVIYNYLSSQKEITEEKFKKDINEKYGMTLDDEQVKTILTTYVKRGILKTGFIYYIFINF